MSFFNTKDLSDITTNMMADCSSMESMLSSTIPPLIANIISVTLTCICLAFFDWRMALAIFCTMPVTFLIIWCGRKLQLRLFDKQVDVKLEASSQIQEYLEGIKIIKSCGLSGSRFSTLDKALQAMRKIAIRVELASGILVQGASLQGFDGIRRTAELMEEAFLNKKDPKTMIVRKGWGCTSCI